MELDQLRLNDFANNGKYLTDKVEGKHNYLKIYEPYFEPLRNNELNILEIGVGEGESLRLWRDYFANSQITSIDIVPDKKKYEIERGSVLIGSQSDPSFLVNSVVNGKKFDIIIDDGSHKSDDIIQSFLYLSEHMASGGIYIIEDLHTIYETSDQDAMDFLKELIDDVNFNGNLYCESPGIFFADAQKYIEQNKDISDIQKSIKSIHFYKSMAFILFW